VTNSFAANPNDAARKHRAAVISAKRAAAICTAARSRQDDRLYQAGVIVLDAADAGADRPVNRVARSNPTAVDRSFGRASRITLNGVSVTRLMLRKPPAPITSRSYCSA
jgi:hypothetical protein